MPSAHIDAILEKAPKDLKNLKKEDFRTLEGDLDKDEDSSDNSDKPPEPHHTTVDFVSLRRAMLRLYEQNSGAFETLNQTIHSLATSLCVDLIRFVNDQELIENIITVFVILFEVIVIGKSIGMRLENRKFLFCWFALQDPLNLWRLHCLNYSMRLRIYQFGHKHVWQLSGLSIVHLVCSFCYKRCNN